MSDIPFHNPVKLRFLEENIAMLKYLSSNGKAIPILAEKILDNTYNNLKEIQLSSNEILILHKELSCNVKPAKPSTILLLYNESKKGVWTNLLGPVRLVRNLMATTLVSLVVFIGVGLSSVVDEQGLSDGMLNNNGIDLLLNLIFILSAAALGGCFSSLFQINKYINNGTYDPKYESSYWIKLLLGLVSGLMLAVLIPVSTDIQFEEGTHIALTIPLLAMLGGFSATLAYRILTRFVWAIESLFVGKQEDVNEQKLLDMNIIHEHKMATEQQIYKNNISKIKHEVLIKKSHDEISKTIDQLLINK